jgi:glycosidase
VWFRNKVVTVIDDHDQVRKGQAKARFCADDTGAQLALCALALNATTLGIPCIYYGSEQGFDGSGGDDRYIREAMFGGEFGAFRSRHRHFFDEHGPIYREFAKVLALRRERIVLRRGRQYQREISSDGLNFELPRRLDASIPSLVPWSRILFDREVLLAINTDTAAASTAWVTIDPTLQRDRDRLRCIYSVDSQQIGEEVIVETFADGRATVRLTVPPAGFIAFE